MLSAQHLALELQSPPLRGRGLKRLGMGCSATVVGVAPPAGARIETRIENIDYNSPLVAPLWRRGLKTIQAPVGMALCGMKIHARMTSTKVKKWHAACNRE